MSIFAILLPILVLLWDRGARDRIHRPLPSQRPAVGEAEAGEAADPV